MMKKICFIAQFPPPIHGLSKAVDTLYNSEEINKEFELEKIDITNNKMILITILKILFSKADLFYFTISQTKYGNIRDLIILKILELKKKKVLVHLHGGYYRKLIDNDLSTWQKRANYKAISKIDGAIVLGPSLKWIFEDMIDDKKIFTVPNCVDDQYLMNEVLLENKINLFDSRKEKHILYLSNFIKSKGYREVLDMALLVKNTDSKESNQKYHFDFAGNFFDNDSKDYFEKFIRDNKLKDYVTYYGVVSGDKKNELLSNCDYFILPTRYPNEGQPISILEAMGNGMVVLTTNHAGIPDLITNKYNGIMTNNIDEYFDYIKECDYKKIAYNNRKKVEDNYLQSHYINNIKNVFLQILGCNNEKN